MISLDFPLCGRCCSHCRTEKEIEIPNGGQKPTSNKKYKYIKIKCEKKIQKDSVDF